MSWLVLLYPPAWRERYGDEMSVVLAQEHVGPMEIWDVFCGALDAWITGPHRMTMAGVIRIRAVAAFAIVVLYFVLRQAPTATTPESRVAMIAASLFVVATTRIALRVVDADCAAHA